MEAIGNLGVMYLRGWGVPKKDPKKAAEKFKEASLKNDAEGMYYYGLCFEGGLGVSADRAQAVMWMKRAAEGGSARAAEWCKTNVIEFTPPARTLPER